MTASFRTSTTFVNYTAQAVTLGEVTYPSQGVVKTFSRAAPGWSLNGLEVLVVSSALGVSEESLPPKRTGVTYIVDAEAGRAAAAEGLNRDDFVSLEYAPDGRVRLLRFTE